MRIDDFEASAKAVELAGDERDPREVEVILREAKRIVRERGPLVITETRHGFICASAGVDHSNAPEPGTLVLLPLDPDASARAVRDRIAELDRRATSAWSSPTRSGGRSGRGRRTSRSASRASRRSSTSAARPTGSATSSARAASPIADEIAGAADLARGKAEGVPAVVVRGLQLEGDGTAQEIVIEPELDLFS